LLLFYHGQDLVDTGEDECANDIRDNADIFHFRIGVMIMMTMMSLALVKVLIGKRKYMQLKGRRMILGWNCGLFLKGLGQMCQISL
jgi:hypothetical protein